MKRLLWVSSVLAVLLLSSPAVQAAPAPTADDQISTVFDLDGAHSSLEALAKRQCGTCKCQGCHVKNGKYKCNHCKCKGCNDGAGKRPCNKCKCSSCYYKKGKNKCHNCNCKKCG